MRIRIVPGGPSTNVPDEDVEVLDDAFAIYSMHGVGTNKCLHVRPGYETFPPRCTADRGHTGPHRSIKDLFLQIDPVLWENTDDDR